MHKNHVKKTIKITKTKKNIDKHGGSLYNKTILIG